MEKIRINKYLSQHGYCSRREADALIAAGKVLINNKRAQLGDRVEESDDVRIAGRARKEKPAPVVLIFHKPVGLMTTTDTSKKDNVISFLKYPERLFPIGRLDVASSGLLLLTNDGALANTLMHPRYEHEKEYEVTVYNVIKPEAITRLQNGIELSDGKTLPARVTQTGLRSFSIVIREGRNRQIRRMCDAVDYEIKTLKRIRIASLSLGTLARGAWRVLTKQEIDKLRG